MPTPVTRDRAVSILGVALIHAALGYALLRGLGYAPSLEPDEKLVVFDVAPEPPPPPPPVVPEVAPPKNLKPRTPDPEGAASPKNLRDTPTPVVVPPPVILLPVPTPIVAAPIAGDGNRPSAGASDVPGPGTGSGGVGTGTGSGASGNGSGGGGGGGAGRGPRLIRGAIYDSDAPGDGVYGPDRIVSLRFVVGTDGRVRDCVVTRSSGERALDAVTCRLITRRFRYRPAENGNGDPIASTIAGEHVWESRPEPEPIDVEPDIPDDGRN